LREKPRTMCNKKRQWGKKRLKPGTGQKETATGNSNAETEIGGHKARKTLKEEGWTRKTKRGISETTKKEGWTAKTHDRSSVVGGISACPRTIVGKEGSGETYVNESCVRRFGFSRLKHTSYQRAQKPIAKPKQKRCDKRWPRISRPAQK